MKELYKLSVVNLLEWVYSEADDLTSLGRAVVDELRTGISITTAQKILDTCGYIPVHILEEGHGLEDNTELSDTDEIELIGMDDNEIYKVTIYDESKDKTEIEGYFTRDAFEKHLEFKNTELIKNKKAILQFGEFRFESININR